MLAILNSSVFDSPNFLGISIVRGLKKIALIGDTSKLGSVHELI